MLPCQSAEDAALRPFSVCRERAGRTAKADRPGFRCYDHEKFAEPALKSLQRYSIINTESGWNPGGNDACFVYDPRGLMTGGCRRDRSAERFFQIQKLAMTNQTAEICAVEMEGTIHP